MWDLGASRFGRRARLVETQTKPALSRGFVGFLDPDVVLDLPPETVASEFLGSPVWHGKPPNSRAVPVQSDDRTEHADRTAAFLEFLESASQSEPGATPGVGFVVSISRFHEQSHDVVPACHATVEPL